MSSVSASVSLEDAVLSGKVWVHDRECALVLTPQRLFCKEFASEVEAFTLALNHIISVRGDAADARALVVTGVFRDPRGTGALLQLDMRMVCGEPGEAHEWVETLNSIITDSNIRAVQADRQRAEEHRARQDAAVAELKQMFPNVDDDVLLSIYVANGNNTAACIEPLLAMSDPNYTGPVGGAVVGADGDTISPQEQMLQDEMLAKMLQDELFMEQLQSNEQMRHTLRSRGAPGAPAAAGAASSSSSSSGAEHAAHSGPSFAERISSMSQATKKSVMDMYRKFTTSARPPNRTNSADALGQEMVSLTVRPAEEEYADFPAEDDNDESSGLLRTKKKAHGAQRDTSLPWDEGAPAPAPAPAPASKRTAAGAPPLSADEEDSFL